MLRVTAVLVALLVVLGARPARGTSCEVPTYEGSLERADIVFVGRAVKQTPGSLELTELEVEKVYAGEVTRRVTVEGGGMKGAMLAPGKRYLVFAKLLTDPGPVRVWASLCGGTQEADAAKAWIARLGDGHAPGSALAAKTAPPAPPPATEPPAEGEGEGEQIKEPPGPPAPVEVVPPAPRPPPSEARGGCAGCAVAAGSGPQPIAWVLLVIVAGLRVRSRASRARCRP
jgi:MYXO-CTERM domain-containing protein